MALIECRSRSTTAPWVEAVGNSANPLDNKAVEIWWFHEVLTMPTGPLSAAVPTAQQDRWTHYGFFDGTQLQNFHYTRRHQLLPLLSRTWDDASTYRVADTEVSGKYLSIDTPVCHGTSGSGVFLAGTAKYLGPVVTAVGTLAYDRLCHDMKAETPGIGITRLPMPYYAALMEEVPDVVADRL